MDEAQGRFRRIAAAGVLFQGGAAAADTGTIVASLVHGLTGSAFAVGAAAAIARYGWLFPQLFVAYAAQRSERRLHWYAAGAFGRVACLAAVCALLLAVPGEPGAVAIAAFFVLWTLYALVSGIVAVPYNDIVARSVPSGRRSRLLALRFLGGGLLALAVAAAAYRLLGALPFPADYALVLLLGAMLLLASAVCFVRAGEPAVPSSRAAAGFAHFVRQGVAVYREDERFRVFVYARWLEGLSVMALPFYVVLSMNAGIRATEVAFLLAAQTAGALASNPLWGWWGDRVGKRPLLAGAAMLAALAPVLALGWIAKGEATAAPALAWFLVLFFVLGAVGNGATIAHLGYLMEISPDERRLAYSGYCNTIVAPATLSPLAGAAIVELGGLAAVFVVSAGCALLQVLAVRRLRSAELGRMRA